MCFKAVGANAQMDVFGFIFKHMTRNFIILNGEGRATKVTTVDGLYLELDDT